MCIQSCAYISKTTDGYQETMEEIRKLERQSLWLSLHLNVFMCIVFYDTGDLIGAGRSGMFTWKRDVYPLPTGTCVQMFYHTCCCELAQRSSFQLHRSQRHILSVGVDIGVFLVTENGSHYSAVAKLSFVAFISKLRFTSSVKSSCWMNDEWLCKD